jgi:hypothetical protein
VLWRLVRRLLVWRLLWRLVLWRLLWRLVRTGPVRTGVSRRRVLLVADGPVARLWWRRRVPRVVRHVAVWLFLE